MIISVIIPCYNSSRYFHGIYNSLSFYLNDPRIEVIFVDDRGSDIESALLKEYVDTYGSFDINTVYLKNDKNLGASISRKRGVEIAKGKYIAFLDSDDIWSKDKLYTQFNLMEKNNIDISGGKTTVIQDNEYDKYLYTVESMKEYTNVSIYDFLISNYFSTSSVMVKRQIILENNFSESLRYSEDYECWRRILLNGKGCYIHSVGVYGFKHAYLSGFGLSSNLWKMSLSEIKGFLLMYSEKNLSYKLKFLIPIAILYSLFKSVRRLLLSFLRKGRNI